MSGPVSKTALCFTARQGYRRRPRRHLTGPDSGRRVGHAPLIDGRGLRRRKSQRGVRKRTPLADFKMLTAWKRLLRSATAPTPGPYRIGSAGRREHPVEDLSLAPDAPTPPLTEKLGKGRSNIALPVAAVWLRGRESAALLAATELIFFAAITWTRCVTVDYRGSFGGLLRSRLRPQRADALRDGSG